MTFALSPAAAAFVCHVHNEQVLEYFQHSQKPYVKTDIMRSDRLSELIFTSSSVETNGESRYRLYDPISNSFLDCVVYSTGKKKLVKTINEYHELESVHHQWGYDDDLNIIPLVLKFEDRIATRYYTKYEGYMPVIETYSLETKNFIVSTLREFLKGGALTQEMRNLIIERSSEIEAMSVHFRPKEQEGSSKMFLHKRQKTMSGSNVAVEIMLQDMLKSLPGYQYFTGTKNIKDGLSTAIQELNNVGLYSDRGKENSLISEELYDSLLNCRINFGQHDTSNSYTTAIKEALKKACDARFEERLSDKTNDDRTRLEATYSRYLYAVATEYYKYYMTYYPSVVQPSVSAVIRKFFSTKGLFDNALSSQGMFATAKGIDGVAIESGFTRYLSS